MNAYPSAEPRRRRAAALACAALLAAPLCGAEPARGPSFTVSVDPRIELLGVVQSLAFPANGNVPERDYAKAVEGRFGRFRDHPAVILYREAFGPGRGSDPLGVQLLFYSDPPALELKDKESRLPYLSGPAGRMAAQRLLWELRDFAAASNFMDFYRSQGGFYRRLEREALAQLGPVEPVRALEAYLGLSLDSRCHYLLSPLYVPSGSNAYIIPYPSPAAFDPASPAGPPFDVYTLAARLDAGSSALWQEPLYVFIDSSFGVFEAGSIAEPQRFYGRDLSDCRVSGVGCAKGYLVEAVIERLRGSAAGASERDDDPVRRRYVDALTRRLAEYESRRDLYPTLWDFFPRLFSAFGELSGAQGAIPAPRPSALRVRRLSDFFGPEARRILAGAAPR